MKSTYLVLVGFIFIMGCRADNYGIQVTDPAQSNSIVKNDINNIPNTNSGNSDQEINILPDDNIIIVEGDNSNDKSEDRNNQGDDVISDSDSNSDSGSDAGSGNGSSSSGHQCNNKEKNKEKIKNKRDDNLEIGHCKYMTQDNGFKFLAVENNKKVCVSKLACEGYVDAFLKVKFKASGDKAKGYEAKKAYAELFENKMQCQKGKDILLTDEQVQAGLGLLLSN